MEIIPAILPKNFAELEEKVTAVKDSTHMVQIDVCDGKLTPEATWPYRKHDENFGAILREERGMPHWEDIDFEIDLMAKDPEKVLLDWIGIGASRVVLHVESSEDIGACIAEAKGLVEIGLALNLDTPLEAIAKHVPDIDFVQCMGIAQIGLQGQPFDGRIIERIREIRKLYPELEIQVDGGVDLDTAPKLVEAGAGRLVVGSAIFGAANPLEALACFHGLDA